MLENSRRLLLIFHQLFNLKIQFFNQRCQLQLLNLIFSVILLNFLSKSYILVSDCLMLLFSWSSFFFHLINFLVCHTVLLVKFKLVLLRLLQNVWLLFFFFYLVYFLDFLLTFLCFFKLLILFLNLLRNQLCLRLKSWSYFLSLNFFFLILLLSIVLESLYLLFDSFNLLILNRLLYIFLRPLLLLFDYLFCRIR